MQIRINSGWLSGYFSDKSPEETTTVLLGKSRLTIPDNLESASESEDDRSATEDLAAKVMQTNETDEHQDQMRNVAISSDTQNINTVESTPNIENLTKTETLVTPKVGSKQNFEEKDIVGDTVSETKRNDAEPAKRGEEHLYL